MKQLTGLDTSFLNMETATQFGHVNSISILDPSVRDGGDLYADLRQTVAGAPAPAGDLPPQARHGSVRARQPVLGR